VRHSGLSPQEPRAAFEGAWIQEVWEGPIENVVGIFWLEYVRDTDSFAVSRGHGYSMNGQSWAQWHSTHMFIDSVRLKATYRWEGEQVRVQTPDAEKTGLTDLELFRPPSFSLPLTGEGRVLHVGEATRAKFHLHRVTGRLLSELGLPFTFRQLQVNTHDEEGQLVEAFLAQRVRRASVQVTTV
jgi:hypothetical protein